MAIKASEIVDEDSLTEWLEGQPEDVCYVIAARAALRVLPIVLSIHQENYLKLSAELKNDLILQVFRASFISWVARKYPTHKFTDYTGVAFAKAGAADDADAKAIAAAAHAIGLAAYEGLAISRATWAVSGAAHATAVAFVEKVSDQEGFGRFSAHPAFSETGIYAFTVADAIWLEKHPDAINALINQRLWEEPDDAIDSYDELRCWLLDKFDTFRQSDLAQNTSFGLIADWYAALLPEKGKPRSLFGEIKDIELARQPEAFWEGEAQEVMNRVAELVGWPVDYRKQEDENTDKDTQAKSEKFSKAKAEKVSSNRMAVRFQLTAILNSIATEVKYIGDQPNEEEAQEDWLKKTQFLERLQEMAKEALSFLPIEPDGTENEKDNELVSKLSEYAQEFEKWLRDNKPEVVNNVMRLGSAAGFTALISLVGGYMPIATPIILGVTCGDKAVDILRDLKSSVSKKKPKDKDG